MLSYQQAIREKLSVVPIEPVLFDERSPTTGNLCR